MSALSERLRTALVDRYAVEREVGRGGMATVFLARDLKHDRRVALKVLHPEFAAALGPERFLREIKVAARLNHPHIVPLHDSGQAGDLLYYVMPFVEGESLRDRLIREKQLAVDDALEIARDVAAALDYAHRQQVVHRDIKPENVMLHEGEALVTDFGIAKAITAAGGENLTQTGLVIGTPAYMSPEQAAGEDRPDGRSDVYSLGCVLYEMLVGMPPFTGPTVQAIITRRLTEPVPSLRAARPTIPEAVDFVVTRALAREPVDRFATAAELAQALVMHIEAIPQSIAPGAVAAQSSTGPKSIAVLPFVNLSNDPENEYFTDGIAEEIINSLTRVQALRVASRTSTFAFRGKSGDIAEIGNRLKVSTVLEGSARKVGGRLRVMAQLVNVADGYQLWSERYDRQLEDVFSIQDEIADNIVKALRVVLSEDEKRTARRAPTENVEAYDCYLRGRQYYHQFRRTSIQFARAMFERAIEIDPAYALAYAGIADCCSSLCQYWEASEANLEGADSASRKALELDPDLAEAHASRGFALSLSRRYEESHREFETAIRLNSRQFEAHYLFARTCFQEGKLEEAVQHYEDAIRVRPEDYQAAILIASPLAKLGRTEDALEALRRGLDVAERHLELNPYDARALILGSGPLAQLGEVERALEWARRAQAIDPDDSKMLYNVACTYARVGMSDDAIGCLDKAIQNGFANREWLDEDPDFDSLRNDPRFKDLRKRL